MVDITFTFTNAQIQKFLTYWKDVYNYDRYVQAQIEAGLTPLAEGPWAKLVQIDIWKKGYKRWSKVSQAADIVEDTIDIT